VFFTNDCIEEINLLLIPSIIHPFFYILTEKEEEEERQALLTVLQNKNVKQRKAASKPKGSTHGKGMFICAYCLYVD